MSVDRATINRIIVGVMAPACLVAALVMWWTGRPEDPLWMSGCIRVGLFLSVLWWALPARGRPAAWANVSPWAFVGLAAVFALVPKYWRVLLPLLVAVITVGLVLRPKKKQRPGGPY